MAGWIGQGGTQPPIHPGDTYGLNGATGVDYNPTAAAAASGAGYAWDPVQAQYIRTPQSAGTNVNTFTNAALGSSMTGLLNAAGVGGAGGAGTTGVPGAPGSSVGAVGGSVGVPGSGGVSGGSNV